MRVKMDPKNRRALFLRASSFVKKRFFEEGIKDFSVLLDQDPTHVDGLYNRGS
jgi:cytochrome c-type biogenesis protein CcmH/NrfG